MVSMRYYVIALEEEIIAKVSSQHVQVDKILGRTGGFLGYLGGF